MNLHVVGGFLGSGKTTAIAAAARLLMQQGLQVGVVTNDQGKYLVDSAFFALADVPAVEVTGGCFCCNYDDLAERLAQLQQEARPDVIFAESVGSCADLVATVIKPLLTLPDAVAQPNSFSVFVDGRLLQRRLNGLEMPYSDNVVYIFDKQIEEAGLLVINKSDLLSTEEQQALLAQARQAFPDKQMRLQSGLNRQSVAGWLAALDREGVLPQMTGSLDMDYERYGAGEAELAWLDQALTLFPDAGQAQMVVKALLAGIGQAIAAAALPVGHVKFLIEDGEQQVKISLPVLAGEAWAPDVPSLATGPVSLIINARVGAEAAALADLVDQVLSRMLGHYEVPFEMTGMEAFHPGFPQPTHRL